MEAMVDHNQVISLLQIRLLRVSSTAFNAHCFCINPCRNQKKFNWPLRLQTLSQRWNSIQVQRKTKGPYSTEAFFVHVVKEGETLTSISRLYGLSIQAIVAVNASIVDVDFILEGQCLNIPFEEEKTKMDPTQKIKIFSSKTYERCQRLLNSLATHESFKVFRLLPSHHVQAKTAGYLLVLVPLIAFCISCIIDTLCQRVAQKLRHQNRHGPKAHYDGSRSVRWKSVLRDLQESNVADTDSSQDSVTPHEDLPVPLEDISHAYTELEPAYLKFLSECGMSKHGYWRGGSQEQKPG